MAGKKKILILDDEQVFAYKPAEFMNQAGEDYGVNCVYSGEEALKALREVQYSMVIPTSKFRLSSDGVTGQGSGEIFFKRSGCHEGDPY